MRLRKSLVLLSVLVLGAVALAAQPRMVVKEEHASYSVGERIDPDSRFLDAQMEEHRLLDVLDAQARVVVLVIFGGGFKEAVSENRGTLWCEDSFDDLSVQRALVHYFKGKPVQFVGVAVPPVFHSDRYGWRDDVFLDYPDDSKTFVKAAKSFIQATTNEQATGMIPYSALYFDPKYRLAQNRGRRELTESFGPVFEWQGKLKADSDARIYGTPTIWLLSPDGTVLAEPLLGNAYSSDPPEINYGFNDVRKLVESLLGARKTGD